MKKTIGVLGGTGYVGAQLLSILSDHPKVEVRWITSEKYAGCRITDPLPHLGRRLELACSSISELNKLETVDLVFSCLPAGFSMNFVGKLAHNGARVIDLSPDFRISDPEYYQEIYGVKHRFPELIEKAVYGLTELNGEKIRNSDIIANPGCFATSVIPAVIPVISSNGTVEPEMVIDIKTALTGAGRAPRAEFHFPESNNNIRTDTLSGHNQKSEIEFLLFDLYGIRIDTILTTSHVPLNRGIFTVMYLKLQGTKIVVGEIEEMYRNFYPSDGFIRFTGSSATVSLNNVSGSNFMDIGLSIQNNYLIIVTVLDNLIKGASGQAVQNMNLVFGFDEKEGLEFAPNYS